MHTINLSYDQQFSLDQTLGCGQVFRWDKTEAGWWYGVVGRHVIKIRQDSQKLTFEGASVPFVTQYFSLDADLQLILETINRDPFIDSAIRRCTGLRLIRQPKWECLISYICSTNSNIPMIRRRIKTIAEQFGREIMFEGKNTMHSRNHQPYHVLTEKPSLTADSAIARLTFSTPPVLSRMRQWEKTMTSMGFEAPVANL